MEKRKRNKRGKNNLGKGKWDVRERKEGLRDTGRERGNKRGALRARVRANKNKRK